MTRAHKHLTQTALVLIILLTLIFFLGDSSFDRVTLFSIPLTQTQTAAVADFDSALVAHYTFDDGTAVDTINGNNGSWQGSPSVVTGKFGQAINLSGTGQYATIPNATALSISSPWTVSAWVRPRSLNLGFIYSYGTINDGAGLYYNGGYRFGFVSNTTPVGDTGSGVTGTLDTWDMVTGTYDGTSIRLYVNGSLVKGPVAVTSAVSANTTAYIGARQNGSFPWNGAMDDLRIYGRALTPAEVSELYTSVESPSVPVVTPPENSTDTISPSTPTNIVATPASATQINVSWTASTDNTGVAGYKVYRNGTLVGTVTSPLYADTNLTASTQYSYTVSAFDAAQNMSAQSSSVSATTQSAPVIVNGKTLTVSTLGTGSGTVTATGINCGSDCSEVFATGSWVELTPVASQGSTFAKWKAGLCEKVDADNKCLAIMRTDLTVYPIFGTKPTISGNTATARSCEMSDVQAAINEVPDGGTVLVPAGTCTWTISVNSGTYSYATKTFSGKSVNIIGAGIDQTIIYDKIVAIPATVNSALIINIQTGKQVRVSGFTFEASNSAVSYGPISVSGLGGISPAFRVDHNKLVNITQKGVVVDGAYGVIDHNTFIRHPTFGSPTLLSFSDVGTDQSGSMSWTRPQGLGTENAIFVEDNIFIHNNPANGPYDAYAGTRYVFRHNTIYGSGLGHHGYDSSTRGVVSFEIYDNSFVNASPTGELYRHGNVFSIRSGSGVFFNNVVRKALNSNANVGVYDTFAQLIYYRSEPWNGVGAYRQQGGGPCNGTNVNDGNQLDIDTNSEGTFDKSSGYPCKDQPGRSSNQILSPVYAWNNDFQGKVGGNVRVGNVYLTAPHTITSTYHIIEGRDFYNDRCRPGYTPYTYPHPLTGLPSQPQPLNCPSGGSDITPVDMPPNPCITQSCIVGTPILGDFNSDGRVNTLDFSALSSHWNQSNTTYDLNKDGTVNTLDFSIMAREWTG